MAIDINIPSQVKTYANLAAFPATGSLKTIFIAEDTNKTYRWTGSVYVEVSAAGATGITIGTTAITSGTVGRVLFEGTGNVVQESANLFWDNTNGRLGIGGTPTYKLDVSSTSGQATSGILVKNSGSGISDYSSLNFANNGATISQIFLTSSTYAVAGLAVIGANGFGHYTNGSNGMTLWADGGILKFVTGSGAGALNTQKMTLFTTGNLAINTTTDAGFKLDVNGTARVQGDLNVKSNYNFTTSFLPYRLAIINAANDFNSFVDLFPKLVTGGSDVGFTVWSKGSPSSITNYELLEFRYDNTNRRYCLDSIAGGTGTVLPFHFYTGTNTNQLKLQINGNVSINSSADLASAQLQVDSTTKGFLPPRMTTTQKNAIASPAAGLMVYDTTLNLISVYNGTTWITL